MEASPTSPAKETREFWTKWYNSLHPDVELEE